MTDHDRGAYTPQTDPPLAFDPRRPSERRPLPMALIGSAVVLVVLLAGVAMVYRGGVREAGENPRPVGEPVMAVKTAPTGAAAQSPAADASASSAGADVYAPSNQTAEAPRLAPAPEQPSARPPPSAATVALLSKPSAPDHVERPAPPAEAAVAAAPTAPKTGPKPTVHKLDETELAAATGGGHSIHPTPGPSTAETTAPKPPPAVETRENSEAKSATTASASRPASATAAVATPTARAASGAAVVQIGAFSSTVLADKGYADVSAALPGRMGGKAMHTLALQKDGGTLYRTWVSGFSGRADAVSFCEALKAKSMACFVKGG